MVKIDVCLQGCKEIDCFFFFAFFAFFPKKARALSRIGPEKILKFSVDMFRDIYLK